MLVLTYASLATVDELFQYKSQNFYLEDFAGYTSDQWGIKAHNRPWIAEHGQFAKGQRIIEVGGAYSLLPKYLSDRYQLEAWIGDDFGASTGSNLWSRWGNPQELPNKYPTVKYIFENFGTYSKQYPNQGFDRIFSVSTLEHIPFQHRLEVFKDMHRCLKPGGMQLHTIDIFQTQLEICHIYHTNETLGTGYSEIQSWIKLLNDSGVQIATAIPSSLSLLDRQVLVESSDVVYRFYPPNNQPKAYQPSASLLLIIEDREDIGEWMPDVELSEINFIIFPDWSLPEESIVPEIKNLIRVLSKHPNHEQITLLVDSSYFSDENANLIVSGIVMSLLYEEDLDVEAGPYLSVIGKMSEIQWSALSTRIQARIAINGENQQVVNQLCDESFTTYDLSDLTRSLN